MTIDVLEVKRRLQLLLNDQSLVEEYLRQFGPSAGNQNAKSSYNLRREDEDPIYEIKLTCPVCSKKGIISYELKSKSQTIVLNKFLVPIYTGRPGFKTVDYTLLAPIVCPQCLFASPDKRDFARISESDQIKSQIPDSVITKLQESTDKRKNLLKPETDPMTCFKRPRSAAAAIDGYNLSLARAKVEAWFNLPYAQFKMGAYCLRIAKILKDGGHDNMEILNNAIKFFEEAFRLSNCPLEEFEMQSVYLLVALNLKIGDQKKASSYLNVFNNLQSQRLLEMEEDPSLNCNTINKWRDKARYLWEDRDDPELFKDE
ncbi:MAG TPA: DUF2225 domain-containing protein [Chitinispirillaceae bacterium]|jgi:uncharacterized protein (DUF2225 family)|nr:DUF2225 domain-containing protein [Chitinispirillaceae bacterium]